MNTLSPKTFEAAKSSFKPLKRSRMTRRPDSVLNAKRGLGSAKSGGKRKKSGRTTLPPRKKLVARLDSLTSQIVRLRDGQCVLCQSTDRLQCGHLFGRRSHGARWDLERDGNCHTQCAGCNQRHNYDPWRYFNWYLDWHGREAFDALYRRWEAGHKYSRLELIALVGEYEAKLEEMKAKQENYERQR